ncbi:MAG: tetratricopeptide repeat protein [Pseudomonadota bacterium]
MPAINNNIQNELEFALYHYSRKNYDDVIAICMKILQQQKMAEAHYFLGCAYGEKGEHKKAIASLEKAVLYKSDYTEALNRIGLEYIALQNHDKAIGAFSMSIKIKPESPEAYNNLGSVYYHLGHFPKAIQSYNKALMLFPKHAKARYGIAKCLLARGDIESAFAEIELLSKADRNLANDLRAEIGKVDQYI